MNEHGHDPHPHPHDDGPHGHGHGHDHDHDHDHPAGLRGRFRAIVRPHSHVSSDSIDGALEASARGIRAVKLSFAWLAVTAAVQALLVVVTGSVALLADTIHNVSDAMTAIPLLIAFRLGRRPPTERYTYGFRRAEDLAGVFVLVMIALSAVIAAAEAVDRLFNPRPVQSVAALFVAGIVGFAGNELVALFRIREGTAIGSAALVADGHHARTDGFTSLAVAAGAVGVWAGFDRADALVGLAISLAIFVILVGAARQIYYRLMDAVDPSTVTSIGEVALATPGVRSTAAPKVRWLGHRLVADLTICVDADLPVREGHSIAEEVRHRLLHEITHLDNVHVHVDPDDAEAHRAVEHHHR